MSGKRISSLLGKITVFVVICCCSLPAQAKYGGGTGEPNDPYLIFHANQMNSIGVDSNDWDRHFKMMADIDLSSYTGTAFNIIGSYLPWHPFTGTFDGNGHTISNFRYTSTGIHYIGLFTVIDGENAEIKDLGLIDPDVDAGAVAYVGSLVGDIRDGTITNCYAWRGNVIGGVLVGGLVGSIYKGTITNCYFTGEVIGGEGVVGGLVGVNDEGTITCCYSSGSVEGGFGVGGLLGVTGWGYNAAITNCYSSCSVSGGLYIGGLVGAIDSADSTTTITNCYSVGSVAGVENVGGLVGNNYKGTVTTSFWDIETSGQATSDGGTDKTTAEMKTKVTFLEWACDHAWTIDEGNDYPRLWWENVSGEAIRPNLYLYGEGTQDEPYLTYTTDQLNMIGLLPCIWDKHFKLMTDIDLSEFTGTEFNIIGIDYDNPFTGVFDGNGHTISNFTYTSTDTDSVGLFGYVTGEINNFGLIYPYVDAGTGNDVGSLVGRIYDGTITNCYVDGGSVSGDDHVGGLVGYNYFNSAITNCYSTGSVAGKSSVGGLIGQNGADDEHSIVSNCYSTCDVTGYVYVGGLVGRNISSVSDCYCTGNVNGISNVGGLCGQNNGTISQCYANGSTIGSYILGGLVGWNSGIVSRCHSTGQTTATGNRVGGLVGINTGTISNCYSIGDVNALGYVGGLVGANGGSVSNCYSTGSVSGTRYYAGGLAGENDHGIISNCYSTGSVSGLGWQVGGLVGRNNGEVIGSFWDIETSGQTTSAGGTGLTTAEMQTMSTFTDADWDFVGETVNGIEDIWFIPQQDYPHLWWKGMQVPMKLTPRTLNCRSYGNWVKAHLTLPEGFTIEDVDSNRPAVLHSFGFESAPLYVFVNKNELVQIEAAFEREVVCSLAGDWPEALTVAGFLADGNIFLGRSKVRIIHPGMKVIEELAWYWLNADCVQPDFCNDIDMNRDSLVNLLDYALLMKINVEFVTDE